MTQVERVEGGLTRVAELLHPARGLLITTGDPGELAQLVLGWADRVDLVVATQLTPPEHGQRAAPEAMSRWFGRCEWAHRQP